MRPPLALLPTILVAALASAALPARAEPQVLPFRDLKTGMKGTGKTVFHGETIESFDVEIVGLLPNIGPDQDLILARCSGGPLQESGILAGMSGSPVYIDGKLIGAVAYSWGFAKEPLAGITPIEEMLKVGARDAGRAKARPASRLSWMDALRTMQSPSGLGAFLVSRFAGLTATPAGSSASLPLAIGGIGPLGIARMTPELRSTGLLPLQSVAAGQTRAGPAAPLQPGSAIGVQLTRGDVEMTATGTVTWVDGDAVYAFGHPLYGLGDVDLPLTAARVEAILPSFESSAKLAIPLREMGAFRQDRATAIFGRLGATPAMIPIRLTLTDGGGGRRDLAFDIVDDPLVTPILLYSALNGVMATFERTFGNAAVRLRQGSVIKLDGTDDVRLDNFFSGDTAATDASGLSAFLLYLVMNNDWSTPRVKGVNLLLDYDREPRTATLRRITLDRYRVKAGGSVTARVLVSPYRGPDQTLTRQIEIPPETPPGPLTLQVGSAASMNRADDVDGPVSPRDLDQLIVLINRLRRNDRVYLLASRGDVGALLGGARLPNLPPSVTTLLTRPRSWGNYASMPQRGVLEDEIPADAALEGFARVTLEVEAP
ncbi:MAG TPA: SpoIVB peptidase S55 domain-containing protein [Candidatus Polarisedimenticolaceae bacterium]|nr:SpoIVB peptidase S55 domain-containing protein [Candidatus Polarisedimenticolaceae bacterium]